MAADDRPTSAAEFARQLLTQLFGDLDGVLSSTSGAEAADNAYDTVCAAAASGSPRGATLYVLTQAAQMAHRALLDGDPQFELPAPASTAELLAELVPAAANQVPALARYAGRLVRYAAEAEPAGLSLPIALATAIQQLYDGMLSTDAALGTRGLISMRTLVAHCDAMAGLLDPAGGTDRPIRVFAPHRFHDYFLSLTEDVQKAEPESQQRPVAVLTRDGRLTALIAESGHPLEAAAEAVRQRVPGDPTTKEHALLRMQGLLRLLDSARHDAAHPCAKALHDDVAYLGLVTAAATTPMAEPGRFGLPQIAQISRYNQSLLTAGVNGAKMAPSGGERRLN